MSEIKKEDIKQEVFDLYDDYAHNRLNRRVFLEKLSLYAVGGLTVPALMSFLMPDYKSNVQIKPDDARLKSEYINYSSPKGGGTIKALLSKPIDAKGKLGGIIVVHENRGLNPYIEDVARRAALAGFISLAPDALTPLGGYPGNDDEGRTMQSKRSKGEMDVPRAQTRHHRREPSLQPIVDAVERDQAAVVLCRQRHGDRRRLRCSPHVDDLDAVAPQRQRRLAAQGADDRGPQPEPRARRRRDHGAAADG